MGISSPVATTAAFSDAAGRHVSTLPDTAVTQVTTQDPRPGLATPDQETSQQSPLVVEVAMSRVGAVAPRPLPSTGTAPRRDRGCA